MRRTDGHTDLGTQFGIVRQGADTGTDHSSANCSQSIATKCIKAAITKTA
jgi:hypothetical protein